jgi:hypothetical protein
MSLGSKDVERFQADGFLVLRHAVHARELAAELDEALRRGARAPTDTGVAQAQYVPMMNEVTPCSLRLLDAFEPLAEALLDAPVVPLRAKGVRYFGGTDWHVDSTDPVVASVGFAAYLEPLTRDTGALQVEPGSHRATPRAAVPLETEPGDVIIFDEHLRHASFGAAAPRRQWRIDYFRAPRSAAEEAAVRAYLARVFPGPPVAYDGAAFPSFGPHWRSSRRPAVAQLERLGVYVLAAACEQR